MDGPDRLSTGVMRSASAPFRRRCARRWHFACLAGCSGGGSGKPGQGGIGQGARGSGGSGNGGRWRRGDDSDGAVAFSRSELLARLRDAAPPNGAHDFRGHAVALDAAVTAYVATPDDATRDRRARGVPRRDGQLAGHRHHAVRPDRRRRTIVGGKDFRDNIYAWPQLGPLRGRGGDRRAQPTRPPISRRAACQPARPDAIEYLLFYEGADTACGAGSPAQAGWPTLDRGRARGAQARLRGRRGPRRAGARDGARRGVGSHAR